MWNLWRDNLYFRNFVCISSARVGKPVKLAPVRHLCRCARSVRATDPLCPIPLVCHGKQKQMWEGIASLFARDVLLSSALPAEQVEEETEVIRPYRA